MVSRKGWFSAIAFTTLSLMGVWTSATNVHDQPTRALLEMIAALLLGAWAVRCTIIAATITALETLKQAAQVKLAQQWEREREG